jgi:hypothetical protein
MIWDKPIMAGGATATPEQLSEAWSAWRSGTDRKAPGLTRALQSAGVHGTHRYHRTPDRVAGRMLQKARKAGAIRFVKGWWEDCL